MRGYRNPFRARASEQLSEPIVFLRNFGAGVLEDLPDSVWDRPLVVRSASGGGKTSLMRLFTIQNLLLIQRSRPEFPELVDQLARVGAITDTGPTHLGILLNLNRDYRSLLDLDMPSEQLIRLFFRLLDARIIRAVIGAALTTAGADSPEQLDLVPLTPHEHASVEADLLGGLNGAGLLEQAIATEREILRPLDALLPDDLDVSGHLVSPQLHSLALLSMTRFRIAGQELPQRPLVMLDDGHELGKDQRDALMASLRSRTLQVARWYSERFDALSNDEMLLGSTEGRDFELVELENEARASRPRHERVLKDVSNRRGRPYLDDYASVQQNFTDLIEVSDHELLDGKGAAIRSALEGRVLELADGHSRYHAWVHDASSWGSDYASLVKLRALEIVIQADFERSQGELFESPLPVAEFGRRQERVRSSARHFLARDFSLPYYVGSQMMAQLGSENIEQYLRLTGDLFEEILAEITLKRLPRLTPRQQDRIVHRSSDRYWREISSRVRDGRLVQQLAEAIIKLAQTDTFRPTAPYAPGVTGIAMLMTDRERLLDLEWRGSTVGADALFRALAGGVAGNVFSVQLDYSVKNQRVMVIYLNRLLCPRYNLPLGRGGFRERRVAEIASWMAGEAVAPQELEIHDAAQLTL